MEIKKRDVEQIRTWIYRNARPLTMARWKVHFEGGSREEVVKILGYYQNPDGGFAHALEADSWSPYSTPIQTNHAVEILREIHFMDKEHPLIKGILRYLGSKSAFRDNRWLFAVPYGNGYPQAPWWNAPEEGVPSRFNPTASLVRFILDAGDYDSELYLLALNLLEEIKKEFFQNPALSMHDLISLETLREYMDEEFLNEAVDRVIEKDPEKWSEYVARPSHFITSPLHPFYMEHKELVGLDLDQVITSRNEEGIWDINWSWEDYPEAFALSRNWWKGELAMRNLRYLQHFGRVRE